MNLDALPELARHLPEAMLVMTHRKPTVCVPFYISLSGLVHSLGFKHQDPAALGTVWLDNAAREMEKHIACRGTFNNPLCDHKYTDMLEGPIGSVRRVFDRFGFEWNETTEQSVARHTRENQQHKFGHHRYHISDFQLTDFDVNLRFKSYLEEFQL